MLSGVLRSRRAIRVEHPDHAHADPAAADARVECPSGEADRREPLNGPQSGRRSCGATARRARTFRAPVTARAASLRDVGTGGEVDESALHVDVQQLGRERGRPHQVARIPRPLALRPAGCACAPRCPSPTAPVTNPSNTLADARSHQQGGGRLAHLPFHLGRVVLLHRAVAGEAGSVRRWSRGPGRRARPPSTGAGSPDPGIGGSGAVEWA